MNRNQQKISSVTKDSSPQINKKITKQQNTHTYLYLSPGRPDPSLFVDAGVERGESRPACRYAERTPWLVPGGNINSTMISASTLL